MAQHDYNLANQTGADFRADLNNALSAIVTVNSGSSEPSTTFAHQLWVDTSSNVLKIRNTANDAWLTTGVSVTASNTFDINAGTVNGITSLSFSSGATVASILDEDNLSSDSATALATQQSIKAYVDTQLTAEDLDVSDGSNSGSIDLDSEVLGLLGGTGLTSSLSGNNFTFAIDGTVATLAGTQTFTNKTLTSPKINGSVAITTTGTEINVLDGDTSASSVVLVDADQFIVNDNGTMKQLAITRLDTYFSGTTATLTNKTLTSPVLNGTLSGTAFKDEDNMSSNSATAVASQQSIKAYVDSNITAQDLDVSDGSNDIAIDLDSETLTLAGGTGIDSTANTNTVTFAIDNTVATLTGSQALTNKTFDVDNNTLSNIEVDNLKSGVLDTDLSSVAATDTTIASAKAIKTYVDTNITAQDLDISDGSSTIAIDLDSETLSLLGGTGVTSTASGNGVTFAIGQSVGTGDDVEFNQITGALVGNASTATALATARTIALSGDVVGSVSFDGTSDVTISSTIQANSVALGTDTTGNYIQTITGTNNKISVSGSGSESADVTLTLPSDVQIANDLTVAGDLTVNGDLTYLDTTNLKIEDNLFELNANLTGSPVNDSGMLINRGNQNNGIFMWDESADKFTIGLTTADGTSTGNITLASLGTLVANLEGNVTGTIQTAAQGNITSLGTLTTLTVDDITINGSTISDAGILTITAGDDFIVNAESDINLDANGGDFRFKDDGTTIATYSNVSSNWYITSNVQDKDIVFQGNDGGSTITALTLDMSDAGTATFNHDIKLGDNGKAIFGAGSDLQIYHDGFHSYIKEASTGNLILNANNFRIEDNSTNPYLFATAGAEVTIYHNGNPKLATTSAGIDVTGTATMDGLTVDAGSSGMIDFGDVTSAYGRLYADSTGTYIGSKSNHNLILRSNHTERMRVDTSGNVGIGTDSPSSYYAKNLVVSAANEEGITIAATATSATNYLLFADGTSGDAAYRGQVAYSHSADNLDLVSTGTMTFKSGSSRTEKMRINSNGTIGVGTSGGSYAIDLLTTGNNGLRVNTGTSSADQLYLGNTGGVSVVGTLSNDNFGIITNGSTRITVDSSGNVGIGTTSPTHTLHVNNSLRASSSLVSIDPTGSASAPSLIFNGDDNSGLYRPASDNLAVSTAGTERMRIDSSGNVGIGTSSPAKNLHISNATNPTIRITDTTNSVNLELLSGNSEAYLGTQSNHPVLFTTNNTEKMRIDTSGNLGLGTSSPQQKLHVVGGEARFDDHISIQPTKKLYLDGGNDTYIDEVAANTIAFNSGGAERLRITSGGNVQIADSGKLVTKKTSGEVIRFERSGDDLRYSSIHANSTDGGGAFIQFKVHTGASATSTADVMTLMGSGLCGIGTASPAQKLHVAGSGSMILNDSTNWSYLRLKSPNANGGYIQFADADDDDVGQIFYYHGSGGDYMSFTTNAAERMRIDSSGNVGIGTANPTSDLTVNGTTGLTITGMAGVTNPAIYIPQGGILGDNAGTFEIRNGGGGSSELRLSSRSFHSFYTGGGGDLGTGSEKMRIDSSGNVLVGVSSFSDSNGGTQISKGLIKLSADTTSSATKMFFTNANGAVGTITTSGSATAYNTSSDARLKDVTGEARGLEVIKELNPVAYNWKADGKADEGLIAQEVLDIVPNAVSGSEEDMYQMDYSKLVVHLVAGMKEQQTQIEELKTQINNLKGE